MSEIRAILPAAGIGKRMRPLTLTRPKVLLPLAGKPLIGHIISDLQNLGIHKITVVVGYYAEKVEQYCREAFPDVDFRFKMQEQRLGLGHAVGEAIEPGDGPVMIVLGDTLFKGNLGDLVGENAALGLVQVEDPRRFGVAVVENDRIVNLEEKPEKPRSNLALAGAYYLPDAQILKAAIDYIVEKDVTTKGEYQITDALQMMIDDEIVFRPIELEGWYDCGLPSTLIETNRILLESKSELNRVSEAQARGNVIHEPVSIAPDVELEDCEIGPFVHIGPRSRVTGSKLSNCIVEADTTIDRSELELSAIGQNVEISGVHGSLLLGDYSTIART